MSVAHADSSLRRIAEAIEGPNLVLVRGDSVALTISGRRPEDHDPRDPRLWPNVVAAQLAHMGYDVVVANASGVGQHVFRLIRLHRHNPLARAAASRAAVVVVATGVNESTPHVIPTYVIESLFGLRGRRAHPRLIGVYRRLRSTLAKVTRRRFCLVSPARFGRALTVLVSDLRASGAREVLLVTPPLGLPSEDTRLVRGLKACRDATLEVASATSARVVDLHAVFSEVPAGDISNDGIHLTPFAHGLVGTAVVEELLDLCKGEAGWPVPRTTACATHSIGSILVANPPTRTTTSLVPSASVARAEDIFGTGHCMVIAEDVRRDPLAALSIRMSRAVVVGSRSRRPVAAYPIHLRELWLDDGPATLVYEASQYARAVYVVVQNAAPVRVFRCLSNGAVSEIAEP